MPFPYADAEPKYLIETRRLGITHADPKSDFDCDVHLELKLQPTLIKTLPQEAQMNERRTIRKRLETRWKQSEKFGYGNYIVWLRSPEPSQLPRAIGVVSMVRIGIAEYPDVGYALCNAFQGNGYASEAASAVITYVQATCGVPIVLGFTDVANTKSRAVLERIGMRCAKVSKFMQGGMAHEVSTYVIGDGWETIDFDRIAEDRMKNLRKGRETEEEAVVVKV